MLLSRMKSNFIVSYRGSGMASTNDVYWIIMELIDGHSLDQVLQDEGPLSEREGIKVIFGRIFCSPVALPMSFLVQHLCSHKKLHITS